ncbi:MAG TPA: DUF1178 family protein [Alphaproteobacteria bacterium]|nr:DUF1178 family protein [Alphaproteobacteria bacterium]
MIVYKLQCAKGHEFEEWFTSGAEYGRLAKAKKIKCPECGDKNVAKALMAPNVTSVDTVKPGPAPCGAPACEQGTCPMMNSQ